MNKNLMAIFHDEFRAGDIVETLDKQRKYYLAIVGVFKSYCGLLSSETITNRKLYLSPMWIPTEDLTLITSFVPLWEVLEKLNDKLV